MPDESSSLLRQYVRERSQDAFAQIVRQYVDIVYASARRQVRDAELARDVTQAVFLVLSQKAAAVPLDRPLSAWLLTTTRYVAANARRAREHRELHERRAAQMARAIHESERDDQQDLEALAPLLDEGLNKLGAGERDALVLKYFEKKSLRQVGEALGISEEAATKRVSRAIERLRVFFQRRGATVTAGALAVFLASESAQAAPFGLAGVISAGASTSAATMAKGAIVLMATQKAKAIALIAAALVFGGGVVAFVVMSVVSQPKHRTAVVSSAFKPGLSATSANGGTGQVTFSDGTSIELAGINNIGALSPTWWTPDGSPVQPPALRSVRRDFIPLEGNHVGRQMVFRVKYGSVFGRSASIRVIPSTQQVIGSVTMGQETLINCLIAVPVGATSATVTLEVFGGGKNEQATMHGVALSPALSNTARPVLSKARP